MNSDPESPRHIALCVLWRGKSFLVGEGYDSVKQERFFRPLGGEVEPGESPEEAVVREMLEEIGQHVVVTRHLGTFDNRFVYEGKPSWEIVDVFEARFDGEETDLDNLTIAEMGWRLAWITIEALDAPLHPEGIAELIRKRPIDDRLSSPN